VGELELLSVQAHQHAAHRTQLAKEMDDLLNGLPHRLVRAELQLASERVVRVADGHWNGELTPPRFVEPTTLHPRRDLVALDL